jgi:hypothetical protein
MLAEGKKTFRYDTFGSEAFWASATPPTSAVIISINVPRIPFPPLVLRHENRFDSLTFHASRLFAVFC